MPFCASVTISASPTFLVSSMWRSVHVFSGASAFCSVVSVCASAPASAAVSAAPPSGALCAPSVSIAGSVTSSVVSSPSAVSEVSGASCAVCSSPHPSRNASCWSAFCSSCTLMFSTFSIASSLLRLVCRAFYFCGAGLHRLLRSSAALTAMRRIRRARCRRTRPPPRRSRSAGCFVPARCPFQTRPNRRCTCLGRRR